VKVGKSIALGLYCANWTDPWRLFTPNQTWSSQSNSQASKLRRWQMFTIS